jgi:hypothetical protein
MKAFDNPSLDHFIRFLLSYLLPGLLCLTIFFFMFDWFFTKVVLLKTEGSGYSKIYRLINNDEDEISIFGASRARGSYIPDTIAPAAYNYGLDEACLLSTNALLDIELQKRKKSPVIIDFTYWHWQTIGDVADYIPFVNNRNILEMLKETGQYKYLYSAPALRYYGYYDYYMKEYLNDCMKLTKTVRNGFTYPVTIPSFNKTRFEEDIAKRLKEETRWKNDKRQDEMLFKLIKSNPQRQFYLTISPFHKSFFKTLHKTKELEVFFNDLRQLPNLNILDYGEVDYPDSLFLNTTHVNYYGAVKFSKALSEKIAKK